MFFKIETKNIIWERNPTNSLTIYTIKFYDEKNYTKSTIFVDIWTGKN